jgi:LmbE family N-acetylglucosaminyl deacetylase
VADGTQLAILHLAPHPDDELIGAPATLMALRDAGHRVVNLACGLGAPEQHERRRRELAAAMALAGFAWEAMEPPLAISAGDDLAAARARLAGAVRERVLGERYDLIVSPSPQDGHHGHEVVGRAAADAIAGLPDPPRWWMWGLWADLPLPTLLVPFGEDRLREILRALAAHRGELARNDFAAAVAGRARAARVLGVERAFGYGEPTAGGPAAHLLDDPRPYAELLTEAMRVDGEWVAARPRTPDFTDPLGPARPRRAIGWWLAEPSVQERARGLRAP